MYTSNQTPAIPIFVTQYQYQYQKFAEVNSIPIPILGLGSRSIPIPILGLGSRSIPIPIPILGFGSWSIPIPIPILAKTPIPQYQYQYQYLESSKVQYQYLENWDFNTNTNTGLEVNTSIIAGVCLKRHRTIFFKRNRNRQHALYFISMYDDSSSSHIIYRTCTYTQSIL